MISDYLRWLCLANCDRLRIVSTHEGKLCWTRHQQFPSVSRVLWRVQTRLPNSSPSSARSSRKMDQTNRLLSWRMGEKRASVFPVVGLLSILSQFATGYAVLHNFFNLVSSSRRKILLRISQRVLSRPAWRMWLSASLTTNFDILCSVGKSTGLLLS